MTQRGGRIALLLLMGLLVPPARADQHPPLLPTHPSPATRLLVVAPHPDDGTLGAGGLIQRVLRAGGAVQVVFMTSGDGFPAGVIAARHIPQPTMRDYRAYGVLRQDEARRALGTLGVHAEDVLFLGFPDGGLCPMRVTCPTDNGQNYHSPLTLEDRPLSTNVVLPHTEYNGEDLTRALIWVLSHFRPTLVVTTHPQDRHPDHCATYLFVRQALQELQQHASAPRPSLLTFLIHFGGWWPMGTAVGRETPLRPPPGFPEPENTWIAFPLTAAEMQTKHRALLQFHSQMLVMGQYLLSFVRANELFRDGASRDIGCVTTALLLPGRGSDTDHGDTRTQPRPMLRSTAVAHRPQAGYNNDNTPKDGRVGGRSIQWLVLAVSRGLWALPVYAADPIAAHVATLGLTREQLLKLGETIDNTEGATTCLTCHGKGRTGGNHAGAADLRHPKTWRVSQALGGDVVFKAHKVAFMTDLDTVLHELIRNGAPQWHFRFPKQHKDLAPDWEKVTVPDKAEPYSQMMKGITSKPMAKKLKEVHEQCTPDRKS